MSLRALVRVGLAALAAVSALTAVDLMRGTISGARGLAGGTALLLCLPAIPVAALRRRTPRTSAMMIVTRRKLARGTLAFHWVPLEAVSAEMCLAAVAAEDAYFRDHSGFDWVSIRDARVHNRTHEQKRGASTITQQVAKNLFLWPARSRLRKALEAWLALLIEALWPKRRILEMYLNIAQFGPDVFGVEAAARRFFAKRAHDLTRTEAALLAAVLPNPVRYQVSRPSHRLRFRQSFVLSSMRRLGDGYLEQRSDVRETAHHPIRRAVRAGVWPVLRAVRGVARWQRGQVYGIRPPRWWPERLDGWVGPRSPHENKRVVIFIGTDRYEFVPAASGKYRGHVHHGALRPDAADLAARLDRLGLPPHAARTLAAISEFEGGFDAIQTWDRGKFSWGFIQFTATGGLPRLLQTLKAGDPAAFRDCFATAGLDIDAVGRLTLRVGQRTLTGRAVHNRLHDDPALWRWFLIASRTTAVQDAQVSTAYEQYYAHPLNISVPIGTDQIRLGDLFADSEYGRAVVCDRAVNRGVGYTMLLFKSAVRWAGARSVDDAPAVLEWVRAAESADAWRLDGLAQKLITTAG